MIVTHAYAKSQGQKSVVQKTERKETDGRTDMTDRITFLANAFGDERD